MQIIIYMNVKSLMFSKGTLVVNLEQIRNKQFRLGSCPSRSPLAPWRVVTLHLGRKWVFSHMGNLGPTAGGKITIFSIFTQL